MASSDGIDATTVLLLILGAILLLPLLAMGLGFVGMMGYGGMMGTFSTTGGWWPLVGMLIPLLVLLVLVGGGYLLIQRTSESGPTQDPSMEELRMAYARGDLTDEEFEVRREKLEQ